MRCCCALETLPFHFAHPAPPPSSPSHSIFITVFQEKGFLVSQGAVYRCDTGGGVAVLWAFASVRMCVMYGLGAIGPPKLPVQGCSHGEKIKIAVAANALIDNSY